MNTFDTEEKLNRFLPRGVVGEWLSTGMDVGEDGGDVNVNELGLVGRIGGSASTVSSSGIISSCLERDGLIALPEMKYIFTINVGKENK
jgi:hypothetical protein